MTDYIRVAFRVPHNTLPDKDDIVHTWSFRGDHASGRDGAAVEIQEHLCAFYLAIKAHLSDAYVWGGGEFSFTDLADPKPRYPFGVLNSSAIGAMTGSQHQWPAEVAVCLSMRGARVSGARAARRRGRVFLGPLQRSAGDEPLFPNSVADLFLASAVTMCNNLQGENVVLSVYSPYTHHNVPVGERLSDAYPEVPAKLDESFVPVNTLWIDNAYDIQRRRGISPTYKPSTAV